jgi:putative membrane protein
VDFASSVAVSHAPPGSLAADGAASSLLAPYRSATDFARATARGLRIAQVSASLVFSRRSRMNHLRSSLSKMSAVAVALGLAACAGSNQPQANAPVGAYTPPPATAAPDQYGAAMGQPAPSTAGEYGATPSTPPLPSTPGGAGMTGGPEQGAQGMPPGQAPQPSTGGATGGMTGGAPGAMGAPSTMGGSMDVSTLNDAQLAAVLQAIEQAQIQEAQLAESKATAPEMKRLAGHMAGSHQQMMSKALALFSRQQITPSDNAVSQQLLGDAQMQLSALQAMGGRDFDREYVAVVIRGHNQAIEMLDRMIPNVRNAELKAELQNLRPKLEAHLREAERVQSMSQKGTPSRQGTSPSGNEPMR